MTPENYRKEQQIKVKFYYENAKKVIHEIVSKVNKNFTETNDKSRRQE